MVEYVPSSQVAPRFSHGRVLCLAGYRDFPAIYTAMIFDLHQVPLLTSRIVKTNSLVFELWSPNSSQRPFLPGNIRSDYSPAPAEQRELRRYDGHSGKHDCLYVPQYLRDRYSHWPFMRRSSMVAATDRAFAAYDVLISHWEVEKGEPRRGRLSTSFIARLRALDSELDLAMSEFRTALGIDSPAWIGRPRVPSSAHLNELAALRSWEATVDTGVAVQRGLREKEAWIAFAQARADMRGLSDAAMLYEEMPPANEEYVGLWINGLEEKLALRYMKAGVPCFIVHQYKAGAMTRDVMHSTPVFDSFLAGTDIETSLGDDNPYQHLGDIQPGRLHGIRGGDDGRGKFHTALSADEERSSSIYVESLPPRRPPLPPLVSSPRPTTSTARPVTSAALNDPPRFVFPSAAPPPQRRPHGSSTSKSALTKAAPPASIPTLPRVNVPRYGPAATDRAPPTAALPAPRSAPPAEPSSSSTASDDRYAAPPLEYLEVHPERVPWVVSPPIEKEAPGPWSKWELAEINDLPAFIFRGKGQKVEAEFERFDRKRKRRLLMHDHMDLEGVLNANRYGAPVPRVPFFIDDNGRGIPQHASHWMYESMSSPTYNVGKHQPAPQPESLPLRRSSKGKGRAASPAPNDEEAQGLMLVDEPTEVRASNVVAVLGLDESISAAMFWRMSVDVLGRARAPALGIIAVRREMWVQLASTTQGQQAFGILGLLDHGIRLEYRSEAEFLEAAQYTADIWMPESTAELDAPSAEDAAATGLGDVDMPSPSSERGRSRARSLEALTSLPLGEVVIVDFFVLFPLFLIVLVVLLSSTVAAAGSGACETRRGQLSDAPVVRRAPLAERLSADPGVTNRPLAARMGQLSLAARLAIPSPGGRSPEPPARNELPLARRLRSPTPEPSGSRLEKRRMSEDDEDERPDNRPKKKVRRGRRSGRVVKEIEARKAERRRAAIEREEAELAPQQATFTLTLTQAAAQPVASTSAIPTQGGSSAAVSPDVEVEREEGEVDEDITTGWGDDDDDDRPMAGPYHR
ncbi:hypothetical protein C8R46DRAFT_1228201 [Mycena filopes]|nr:hypothetical protein C8R46DRAFT_1228201 [Mycena filopes]